jgi:excinuclease ABC subunit B
MEYNKLNGITPTQVAVKRNVLLEEAGSEEKYRNPRLANSVTGKVSAANSYDNPTYIPDPTDLGKGSVSVGLGHDSKRESNSAYVDGYVQADLAAVLQDPVIRSMSRTQVEKAVEQAKRNMQKAASDLDFMAAAKYRDEMWALQQYLKVWKL